jgi:hypothetical protein
VLWGWLLSQAVHPRSQAATRLDDQPVARWLQEQLLRGRLGCGVVPHHSTITRAYGVPNHLLLWGRLGLAEKGGGRVVAALTVYAPVHSPYSCRCTCSFDTALFKALCGWCCCYQRALASGTWLVRSFSGAGVCCSPLTTALVYLAGLSGRGAQTMAICVAQFCAVSLVDLPRTAGVLLVM